MGKKLKLGKSRKDKFYKLSKEIGYRSRAAFKLIQLNQKYSFLQKSSVLLDLCAAPGGWLQVAAKTLPASSLIIGIDLAPIKPLPNVEMIQEDITTDKCYSLLKRFLKTCKIDCVLHDGAPNLGNNWLYDAHSQARLTFSAFKLAINFLAPGGWFVTKLFRSKDYNSMIWLFQKFFRKVESTKPPASRNESAEIYVVCQDFVRFDKIDPKFLDPKFIFQEVDDPDLLLQEDKQIALNNDIMGTGNGMDQSGEGGSTTAPQLATETVGLGGKEDVEVSRQKFRLAKHVDGHLISDVDFIRCPSHKTLIAGATCHEVVLVDPRVRSHPLTTPEIRELCSDVRILGKGDVRILSRWATKLKKELFPAPKKEEGTTPDEPRMTEDEMAEKMVLAAQKESDHESKLKRRKVAKMRLKLAERMRLKMDIPHEVADTFEDEELFDIKRLVGKEKTVDESDASPASDTDESLGKGSHSDDESDPPKMKKKKRVSFKDDNDELDAPLVVDLLPDPQDKHEIRMEQWFDRPAFKWLNENLDQIKAPPPPPTTPEITDKPSAKKRGKAKKSVMDPASVSAKLHDDPTHSILGTASDGSVDVNHMNVDDGSDSDENGANDGQGNSDIPDEDLNLETAEEIALASYMVQSKKKKGEIVDWSYHRFTFGDAASNLPDWFVADESKHYFKPVPPQARDREAMAEARARLRAIDARPIKKVIEARARKKGRLARRLSRALQRAQKMSSAAGLEGDGDGSSAAEAAKQKILAKYSRKISTSAKRDKVYVVAHGKKGGPGRATQSSKTTKRGSRPPKNAKVKRVDRRMKKETRAAKARTDRKSGGGGKGRKKMSSTSFGKRRR